MFFCIFFKNFSVNFDTSKISIEARKAFLEKYSNGSKIGTFYISLAEGEKLIQFQKARDESRRRSGLLDMNYIEMMNERKLELENEANKKEVVDVKEEEFGNEYDELIGF